MATIGIDLGTTNSLVAYFENNETKIIPNIFGNNLTPSVVSVDDNNEIIVGEIAKERLITHPNRTIENFKRYMGTEKKCKLGPYEFLPEELSSFVLKVLKQDAESYLKEEITDAVISVPAYFNDAQRKATKRAGELAGLKVERLISEPTAAAICYGLHEECDETQFLVFDLGGGTFDVSILEIFEGVMEVKSIAGDNYLGGQDFNNLLISYFIVENNLDIDNLDKKILPAIFKQAEICKRQLSNRESGKMSITIEGNEITTEISRTKFEKICEDLILKLRYPIERAFRDAKVSPKDIDAVILIGGSTNMYIVRNVVSKMFNKLPYSNINPDEAVALGAAIQAALKERNEDLKELVLTDVCPYTLGVDICKQIGKDKYASGYFLPIIERNSPIPISRVERLVTATDNQKSIHLNIYQGESRKIENNIKLGELKVKVPKAPKGQESIDVRYTYDINGLLEVEVTIVSTGEKKNLIIEKNEGSMTKEEIENRLSELEKIKIHPRDKAENRLIFARGERLYEESLGDTREYIGNIISEFERILNTQDNEYIKKEAEKITEIFDELERYY